MKILESKVGRGALLVLCCCSAVFGAESGAYVRSNGNTFVLGNEYIERTITLKDGHPSTSQFQNKISGRSYAVSGKEFELQLIWERLGYTPAAENPWKLTAADFKSDETRKEEIDGGGKRLIFALSNRDREPALHVELVYEISPGQHVTRQWLHLKTEGRGSLFAHYVAVQSDEWYGVKPRLGGFGQPIYSDDLFWGLEYPSGLNKFDGHEIALGSYVGVKIDESGFTTAKAVTGVAAPANVQQEFFAYINSIRAQPVRPYVLYNTWYDLQRLVMTGANTRERVTELNQILQDRYKLKLNSFVLDDGWDNMNKLWTIDSTRFPDGFRDLAASLKQTGSGLGIWYGPVGGYDDREIRIAAGKRLGMEVESSGNLFCLAGRHYSEYFTRSVLEMQKTYDLNYLKLDGVPFGCNEPDHGHPTGIYSREADERAFVNLLEKLRQQKRDIFLNITTGIWLSPWWLQYADTVWMGGEDSGYLASLPTLSPRQSALSYRDSVLYDDFVRNQYQFPMSSLMTHGIIRGKFNLLGGSKESFSDWRDEVVHYVSVGNMMTELYITPELLDRDEWDTLAATLHWAQANQHPLLDDSKIVLGDPAKRQPYAFVHASPQKTIITLRNPFAEPKFVRLPMNEASGVRRSDTKYRLETLYPFHADEAGVYVYGDTITASLGAFEERVLELDPDSETPSGVQVTGARFSVEHRGNETATVHLYAEPGERRTIHVSGNQDGKHEFDVQFGARNQTEGAVTASAPVMEMQGEHGARFRVEMDTPQDVPRTTVAVLFEPERQPAEIRVSATDNGATVALTTESGKGAWQWFSTVLQPGKHRLQFVLDLPPSMKDGGKLSAWAIAERHLAEASLPIQIDKNSVAAAALPVDNSVEKQTIRLLEKSIR